MLLHGLALFHGYCCWKALLYPLDTTHMTNSMVIYKHSYCTNLDELYDLIHRDVQMSIVKKLSNRLSYSKWSHLHPSQGWPINNKYWLPSASLSFFRSPSKCKHHLHLNWQFNIDLYWLSASILRSDSYPCQIQIGYTSHLLSSHILSTNCSTNTSK